MACEGGATVVLVAASSTVLLAVVSSAMTAVRRSKQAIPESVPSKDTAVIKIGDWTNLGTLLFEASVELEFNSCEIVS